MKVLIINGRETKKKDCPDAREQFPVEILEDERVDDLQRNGYHIIQKRNGFCFGMDAVLLAGFARVNPGERAIDLGTGTGIIPILLEARYEGEHYTGLEIQEEVAEMARRSVRLNGTISRHRWHIFPTKKSAGCG